MLRTDRLEAVTAELVRIIETTPTPRGVLPPLADKVTRLARVAGLDLEAMIRSQVTGSLTSLASRASAEPERADALADWLAHLIAWLRDERDDPPAADFPLL